EGETAENAWSRALEASAQEDAAFAAAGRVLEAAYSLDPRRADVKSLLADVTFERALAAERDGRTDLLADLVGRLEGYDEARSRRARLQAPATLTIDTKPPGAEVFVEQVGAAARRSLGRTPLSAFTLDPASYVLVFHASGRVPVRFPILVAR